MSKKKLSKKAAAKFSGEHKSPGSPKAQDQTDEGGRPDYGGLPNRNLKKNLGCG